MRNQSVIALLGIATAVTLTACTAGEMRVEVEVYKGPLAEPIPVQLGELAGILQQAQTSLRIFKQGAELVKADLVKATNQQLSITNADDQQCNIYIDGCDDVIIAIDAAGEMIDTIGNIHATFPGFVEDKEKPRPIAGTFFAGLKDPIFDEKEEYGRWLIAAAAEIGTELKAKAFFSAFMEIGDLPEDTEIRRLLTHFTTLTSEYGNQILARATALALQIDGKKLQADRLPLSTYLRDAEHSDFVNLYDWFEATSGHQPNRYIPFASTRLDRAARVALAQRLYANHYWSKVNEVHASGQGEVRMAFIRDAIGNWNLKSFDNDPEELLKAYRSITEAGIDLATRVASGIATGGVSEAGKVVGEVKDASSALGVADQLIKGRVDPTPVVVSDAQIEAHRERTVRDLEFIKASVDEASTSLKAVEATATEAKGKADAANAGLAELEGKLAARQEIDQINADLKSLQDELTQLGTPAAGTAEADRKTELEKQIADKERVKAAAQTNLGGEQRTAAELQAAVAAATAERDRLRAEAQAANATLETAKAEHGPRIAKLIADARRTLATHRQILEALQAAALQVDVTGSDGKS